MYDEDVDEELDAILEETGVGARLEKRGELRIIDLLKSGKTP